MAKPGARTTYRYSREFKATAVRLSQIAGVAVGDVAESLYIHPFMLSRWRKQAREGVIVTKGVAVDKDAAADGERACQRRRACARQGAPGPWRQSPDLWQPARACSVAS